QPVNPLDPRKAAPARQGWFRTNGRMPDGESLHRRLPADVSDFYLLGTAPLPPGLSFFSSKIILASIAHPLWFHRAPPEDDWPLCALDSPSASGARGFGRGSVFSRDGRLVASTAQEGLVRVVGN